MRPNLPDLEHLDEDQEEAEIPETQGPVGSIPRFPKSPSPPSPPPLRNQAPETAQEAPEDPSLKGRSSPGSTEPTEQREEWVDPKDLQAAIAQTVDVGFVLIGQGLGQAERRAKGLPGVDPKWVPTAQERKMVQDPASRIAKRHIKAPAQAADVIDGCLVATGVGTFAMRGLFGVEALGANND